GRVVFAHDPPEALTFSLHIEGNVPADLEGQVIDLVASSPTCGDLSELNDGHFRGRLTRLLWSCMEPGLHEAQVLVLEWETTSGQRVGLDFYNESGSASMRRDPVLS